MSKDSREALILAADVGGTNLSLALMSGRPGKVRLLKRAGFRTSAEPSMIEPARRFLEEARREGYPMELLAACVSGAGPVTGRRIPLTNVGWDIDARALEAELGVPVHLLNDFTAVAHGVMLLDPADPGQLLPLPHGDLSTPRPEAEGTALLVGAGTGLGVGYVTRADGDFRVHASEGGHIGLPVTGEETLQLWKHLRERFPGPPGAETAVSGPGIGNIFRFLVASGRYPGTSTAESILALPERDQPAAIARSGSDPVCRRAMEVFVELYGRVCADLAAAFLPRGGLFLAGGIAAKNADHFLGGRRFMASFERNYRPHIDAIVRATPVYIVRDYAVSLFGAADAALRIESR